MRTRAFRSVLILLFLTPFQLATADHYIHILPDPVAAAQLGSKVAALGDLNSDGVIDFAVTDIGANNATGQVTIYSGATRSILATLVGGQSGDRFGTAIANVGDVNADGVSDFAVSAQAKWTTCYSVQPTPASDYTGYVRVYSGKTKALLYTVGGIVNAIFGWSVAGVGDVDGDGAGDFVVGIPWGRPVNGNPCTRSASLIYLYSGKQGGAPIRSFFQSGTPGAGGWDVASVGDYDGDGFTDFADDNVAGVSPQTLVFSAKTGAWLATIPYASSKPGGRPIAGMGDLNHDGFADFAVATQRTETSAGSIHFIAGHTGVLIGTILAPGPSLIDYFGYSIANLGDYDGDGTTDIGVLSGGESAGLSAVRIYSGATRAELSSLFLDDAFNLSLGDIAKVGTLDLDAIPDFVVGAPYDIQQGANGSGFVLLSRTLSKFGVTKFFAIKKKVVVAF